MIGGPVDWSAHRNSAVDKCVSCIYSHIAIQIQIQTAVVRILQ